MDNRGYEPIVIWLAARNRDVISSLISLKNGRNPKQPWRRLRQSLGKSNVENSLADLRELETLGGVVQFGTIIQGSSIKSNKLISFYIIISYHIIFVAYAHTNKTIINSVRQPVMPILLAIFIKWSILEAEAAGGKRSTAFGAGSFAGVPGPPQLSFGDQNAHVVIHMVVQYVKNPKLGWNCFVRWRRSVLIIIALTSFDHPVLEWLSFIDLEIHPITRCSMMQM